MIKLSKRLQTIASMVTEGNRLADVGTDHGFLPLYLLEQGKIPFALAMDVNQGPLERAKEHIETSPCKPYIQTRLSDGLSELMPNEVDTIVIAGMGGGLMVRILTKELCKLEGVRELILQPQSEQWEVRKCLEELGFVIVDEDMLEEDGKYYVVMRALPQQLAREATGVGEDFESLISTCQEIDLSLLASIRYAYGPVLLKKHHPVLREWLEREVRISQEIIQRLSLPDVGEKARARRDEVIQKMQLQKTALKILATM